ncbi:MAG: hypothetical protein U0670_18970 [Anaerolineae bacterium]
MSSSIEWIIDKRVLLITLPDVLTGAEISDLNSQSFNWLKTGTQPIHLLVDCSQVTMFPLNMLKMKQIINVLPNPRMGCWVIIGANRLGMYTALLLGRLFNVTILTAQSVEQAKQVLLAADPTLAAAQSVSASSGNGGIK